MNRGIKIFAEKGVFVRYVSAALALMFTYIVISSIIWHTPKQTFVSGWEYPLLILVVSLSLLGSGKILSVEQMILKKEI